MIYCKATFERGSGIGTRLFPWARATHFSEKYGIKMLAPHWIQPRIGPLLRGGIDLSSYHRQILLMGLFKHGPNNITGFKRFALEMKSNHLLEPNIDDLVNGKYNLPTKGIINFSGDNGRFKYLNGQSSYFREKLIGITNRKWLKFIENKGNFAIGINVRMGNDFVTPKNGDIIKNHEAIKTPIDWFVNSLKVIRRNTEENLPAIVVTDGTEESVAPLINMKNVTLLRPGCAISDLLILSNCKILLRSGGSSFSAWAAYLGQMPAISPPGQALGKFNLINDHGKYIGEFNPEFPDEEFISQINRLALN